MKRCKHCKSNIVLINTYNGQTWYHQPAGASFNDGMHLYCQVQEAEPEDETEDQRSEIGETANEARARLGLLPLESDFEQKPDPS